MLCSYWFLYCGVVCCTHFSILCYRTNTVYLHWLVKGIRCLYLFRLRLRLLNSYVWILCKVVEWLLILWRRLDFVQNLKVVLDIKHGTYLLHLAVSHLVLIASVLGKYPQLLINVSRVRNNIQRMIIQGRRVVAWWFVGLTNMSLLRVNWRSSWSKHCSWTLRLRIRIIRFAFFLLVWLVFDELFLDAACSLFLC